MTDAPGSIALDASHHHGSLRPSPRRVGLFVVMAGRNAGGPEIYEHALLRNLAMQDHETDFRVFCFTEAAAQSFKVEAPNVRYHVIGNRFRPYNTAVALPLALKREGIDLMHATCVPPPFSPVAYVFTLHCSSMFIRPELFPPLIRLRLKALVHRGVHSAKRVLCVSQDVLDHAVEYYGVSRDRFSVTYNGVGSHFRPTGREEQAGLLARLGIDRPYFLFTGRLEPRKNVVRLLEAFDIFRREVDRDTLLVLAGNKTWAGTDVDRTITRLDLGRNVVQTGYVANSELPALFGAARAFVFPSLWEGFGIPVVEAMACGTPVVTSNVSSLPEIAGGAALLVDPLRVADIARGMERLALDEPLRAKLRQAGLRRALDFSWQRAAELTRAAYSLADRRIS